MQNQLAEPRKELFDRGLHGITEVLPFRLPVAIREMVRRVHDEARHDVLSGGGHVRVDGRLHTAVQERPPTEAACLAIRERFLEVVDGGAEVGETHEDVFPTFESRKGGQIREREVHLRRGSLKLVVSDIASEILRKIVRVHQPRERLAWVECAHDNVGIDDGAVLQFDTRREPIVIQDTLRSGVRTDGAAKRFHSS